MFKGEGYYVADLGEKIFYAENEEEFNEKIKMFKEYPICRLEEDNNYSHLCPFFEKIGRKVIEEIEHYDSGNNGFIEGNFCTQYDKLQIWYELYNGKDQKYLDELLSKYGDSSCLFENELSINKIILEECGFDVKKLNSMKNIINSLEKGKLYLIHEPSGYNYYKKYNGETESALYMINIGFEEVDNEKIDKKIKLIEKYYQDFMGCNCERFTYEEKYEIGIQEHYDLGNFIQYIVFSNDPIKFVELNKNSKLLREKENLDIIKAILNDLSINDSILFDNNDNPIYELLTKNRSEIISIYADDEKETYYLLISNTLYPKLQKLNENITKYKVEDIESVLEDIVTDDQEKIEREANWISHITTKEYQNYKDNYQMIKGSFFEDYLSIEQDIGEDLVATWIE